MSASQRADSLHKMTFLLILKSKMCQKIVPFFFSLHIVNLVGTGKAIHLVNALIKIINIHIITGQFSSAIIHQALWYHNCSLWGQYQISKFHTLLSSGNSEHRISKWQKWWGKGDLNLTVFQIALTELKTPSSVVLKKIQPNQGKWATLQQTRSPSHDQEDNTGGEQSYTCIEIHLFWRKKQLLFKI